MNRIFRQVRYFAYIISGILAITFIACGKEEKAVGADENKVVRLTQYVNPFIGTGGHGHTFPGAVAPFGMVQPSPDMGITGWDWCAGYHYSDSIIVGFAQTHLSGTGIGDLADVLLMPLQRKPMLNNTIKSRDDYDYKSSFSHSQEKASPGFYEVYLPDNQVKVSLTATPTCAFHQYVFDKPDKAYLVLDLSYTANWDKTTETHIKVLNDTTLMGYRNSTGWAKHQKQFFAIRLSAPMAAYELMDSTANVIGNRVEGKNSKALLHFKPLTDKVLKAKIGLSSATLQGALKAVDEELRWDFEQVKQSATAQWEALLSKIEVTTPNERLKTIFYTALYHSHIAPMQYTDAMGQYKSVDSTIQNSKTHTQYTVFSLWDTFRAAHPLLTITKPEIVNSLVSSMLAHYDAYGLLPVWELVGNETNTMTGYHAVPVIVDAYFKGFRDYDIQKAYKAIKASGMQDIRGTNFLKTYGYIPADLENESVTKNLEYAFDDWCIAMMAQDLGYAEDYDYFMKRAMSYQKLFDPTTNFMRGKLANGQWKTPFDPKYSAHRVGADYTEGNAWQHSWFVPHDVPGLIQLMGGPQPFVNHLDSLFNMDSEITGDNVSADISGLIGQYAHGNEPSHHIAYMYNYAGQPWKSQATARLIMDTMYDDTPEGLSGNEDCGQMSAWYVFSALGFYPMNPASGIYMLGSPMFDQASIHLEGGKKFITKASNVSKVNKYIQKVTWNGKIYDRNYITHEMIMQGGELVFEMSETPNKQRGIGQSSNPPSATWPSQNLNNL